MDWAKLWRYILTRADLNINAENDHGSNTALSIAKDWEHEEVVEVLENADAVS